MFQVPSYLTAFIGSVLFSEATSLFQSVCLKNFNKIIFKKLGYCKIATNKWQKESQGCLFFTSLEVYWSYWQSVLVQESVRSLCFGLLVCFDYYKFWKLILGGRQKTHSSQVTSFRKLCIFHYSLQYGLFSIQILYVKAAKTFKISLRTKFCEMLLW